MSLELADPAQVSFWGFQGLIPCKVELSILFLLIPLCVHSFDYLWTDIDWVQDFAENVQ